MKSIEVTAKTVDEAITSALIQLEASSDEVEIEILEEGKKALGLFGKNAKIRAILYSEEEKAALASAQKATATAIAIAEAAAEDKPVEFAPQEFVTADGSVVSVDDSLEKRIREAKSNKKTEAPKEKKVIDPISYEIPADADEVSKELVAFLKDVLDAMGVENKIEASFTEEGILNADISAPDGTDAGMGVVIGKRASTLDSLQYLATLVLNKNRNDHLHIKLDTCGYRKRREQTLEKLAFSIAANVRRSGKKIALDPMNPYERRIIHTALQDERGVETFSEGEEPYRRVVIAPVRKQR